MSKKIVNYSWRDKMSYSWQDSKWLLLTPLAALIALYGFTATWLSYPVNASGWEMALDFANKDLVLLPGLAPGALALLWLVPCTALLLLGWGITRLFWVHLHWVHVWLCFLGGVCLVLMSSFGFPLFLPETLQNLHGRIQIGFWLTSAALLLSAIGLLIPNPTWWKRDTDQQPASEKLDIHVSRRRALTSVVNLGGLLVVGSAVGLDLGWLTRPNVPHHQVLSIGRFQFSTPSIRKMVWSPDNVSLLECLSGSVRSWEIATGKVRQTYLLPFTPNLSTFEKSDNFPNSIALSPDGRRIAAVMDIYGVIIWDVASGHFVQRFAPADQKSILTEYYGGVTWSPDNSSFATSKFVTENQAALFIVRASDLKQLASYPLSDIVSAISWSGDGRMLAVITEQVEVWDISHGKKIWTYQPPRVSETSGNHEPEEDGMVADVAWAPDSQRLALSLNTYSDSQPSSVLIWDIPANRQVLSCQGHWGHSNELAWSPDGTRIAATGSDWTVQVWNAQTGERLLTYQGHRDEVWSVAWSPDGKFLASGSADDTIQIWEAPRL
jgi:WD40 repeat protein